jgi:hypothetical protein
MRNEFNAIVKAQLFEDTLSSAIEHVQELSLFKFVLLLQDTLQANGIHRG